MDDRTPDPAVQVVAEALAKAEWEAEDGTNALCSEIAAVAVAALREAGHIKNLRQVGWLDDVGNLETMEYGDDRHDTPVYVEEGDQR